MMTSSCDDGEMTPVGLAKLVADVWFIVMSLLSPADIVRLSHTCKTIFEYAQFHNVWNNALSKHHFLPKSYPHLCDAPTGVIRRQLVTTTHLDDAFSNRSLKPRRSYSFPLEFPGVFQGMKFIPGGEWLVLLFHSRTLNPARHSNICLFRPPMMESNTTETAPVSVTLQSNWCWLHLGQRDGPYKSSRGDDLMLLRTSVKNEQTFAICHLDTKTPSVKITFMVHTTVWTRNYVVAGDYLVYGWITDDRKHMVRIMKLNEDYTKLNKDVIAVIDCPSGNDGRLMVRYDLRLSGKKPRLLLVTTRLMAAYDISDGTLTSGSQSSPLKLRTVWKYVPEHISFGRILQILRESAIVTLYEGKVRFVYPELDNAEPDAKTIATYEFASPTPYNTKHPAVLTSQRIFWSLRLPNSLPAPVGSKHLIEAATLPIPSNGECKIDRVLIDHDELVLEEASLAYDPQDWDELSGKLCVRCVRSKHPHEFSWRKASWRITILGMV